MPSQSVTGIPEDQALPKLAQALNTELMLPVLEQVAGLQPDAAQGMTWKAEVLNHKPGQRCTIRYSLARPGELGQPMQLVALIGKLYHRRRLAERLYRWTHSLRSGPFNNTEPLCLPAPLLLVPKLRLVLLECAAGIDLRHALSAGAGEAPLSLAARWLAQLHGASPVAGLKTKSLEHELRHVDRWCEEIAPQLTTDPAAVQRLRRTQDVLGRVADEMLAYEPVMIHRDFYYANIFWDGQRLWVLDFDQLSVGDPALDVGHFLAHLENFAYRTTGLAQSFAEPANAFLQSYLERNSSDIQVRVGFYRAYTFLKLAATEVIRKRGRWVRFTEALTDMACREVEPLLGGA